MNAESLEMVFTMGLPGAGKSTVSRRRFPAFAVIDPDAIKAERPDYDPAAPSVHHEWSKQEAERRLSGVMAAGISAIVDGTGTDTATLVDRMRRARAAGYRVRLLYVTAPLGAALARNAARARTVPAHIIHEKAAAIATAFDIAAREADTVDVVDNAAPVTAAA